MIGKSYFGYVGHAWRTLMSAWIPTALGVDIIAISAITAVHAGLCTPGNCFDNPGRIDFSSVPETSKKSLLTTAAVWTALRSTFLVRPSGTDCAGAARGVAALHGGQGR
jgi:hypothetical protein